MIRCLALIFLGLGAAACGGSEAAVEALPGEGSQAPSPVVRRGCLASRLLLTGELKAEEGYAVVVPQTSTWQVQIRWVIDNGSEVQPGDLLLELDNTAFTGELEDKRLAAAEKANTLARRRAELAAAGADAAFRVEEARLEVEKARILAAVPESLLARRETEDRRLALARARAELAKAEADLGSQQVAAAAELAQLEIDLGEQERVIADAETAIAALRFTAPQAGVAVVEDHPWEPRKLREGDTVWVGMTVLRLPDLTAMIAAAELSDVDQGRLAVGDPVTLTLDAYPESPFPGRVTEISPIAREERGESLRRFFRAVIHPEAVDLQRMRPGMSVKVEARHTRGEGDLLIPRAALDLAAAPPRARLADGREVEVQLGPCSAQDCAVLGGLEEGQRLRPVEGGE